MTLRSGEWVMRLKLGRPDLADYSAYFDLPAAAQTKRAVDSSLGDSSLGVTFMGVSTLLIDDGQSALLTDGFFTRPSLGKVLLGRIAPDEQLIDACLARCGAGQLRVEAVLPVHSHYDHGLDSAVVAQKLGSALVGGSSAAQLGLGVGLSDTQIVVANEGVSQEFGPWKITLIEADHCPPDRYPGEITSPVRPPVRTSAYRCGEAWSILLQHTQGETALIQGSAGFVPNALSGRSAQVAYLGVGQLGLMETDYIESYWEETVVRVSAERVILIHWDDFFKPLPMPGEGSLRALPYAGDDLDVTMSVFARLAQRDGVRLSFPKLWERHNPWQGG